MEDDFEMKDRADEEEETPDALSGDAEKEDETLSLDAMADDELDPLSDDDYSDKDEW